MSDHHFAGQQTGLIFQISMYRLSVLGIFTLYIYISSPFKNHKLMDQEEGDRKDTEE
jgi:hypothetical protein